jgi:hypothetical protein
MAAFATGGLVVRYWHPRGRIDLKAIGTQLGALRIDLQLVAERQRRRVAGRPRRRLRKAA